MPHSLRPHGQVTPALDQVNDRIRRLMDEPAGEERSASYAELLVEWAEVSRDDVVQAA
ncbi:hypothetical protein OG272_15550 [Streptomyces sp. NBC_00104]|uniref:hypothetical protein n=1 Tax=Streptomyces sp. NBC_00104 TaxID=2903621 RepID=UPI0032508842